MLIADEPTTALDVTVQAQILTLMRELRREFSTSILMITHDMGVVAEMADRVAIMQQGKIVEQGDALDIFARPTEPYTRQLLAAVPRLGAHAGTDAPPRLTKAAAPSAEKPVLVVKDLSVTYGARKRLVQPVAGCTGNGQRHFLFHQGRVRRSASSAKAVRVNRPPARRC